jgi:rubrerythrin
MPTTQTKSKKYLTVEFEMLKSMEESAVDLYQRISADSRVQQLGMAETFSQIVEDEKRHASLVQKIINIITNSL